MQKMALYASRRKGSIVRLQENHANYIVPNVPLSLQLLRIMTLVR